MAGRHAFRDQSRGQPDFHSDSVWDAKSSAGCRGYPSRLGHNHLVYHRYLAELQMDSLGSDPVFDLGLDSDGLTTNDHDVEPRKLTIDGVKRRWVGNSRTIVSIVQSFNVFAVPKDSQIDRVATYLRRLKLVDDLALSITLRSTEES